MGNLHFRISYWWMVAVILSIAGWDLGTAPSAANFLQVGQHATGRNLHVVQAQIGKLIGNWQIVWTGARDTYTGVLEIVRKQDENLYLGQVTLTASKGGTVIQDVRITTTNNEIHIECSNPREPSGAKRNYNPDRFFVTLIGNRMEGYSLDTAGQRGQKSCSQEPNRASGLHQHGRNKPYGDTAQSPIARLIIYLVAFLTGGIVMGFEMLGSRYLNPYFGSGIYTWASLISTVLAALSVGYFVGGWIADRYPSVLVLALSVIAGSVYLIALPMFGDLVLDLVLSNIEDVRIGSLVAAVLLMFWPVTWLGMYTPFAIRLLIRSTTSSGKTSGIIYGISAAGSIIGTLGITFLLIPTIGSRAITLLLRAGGTIGELLLSALPVLFRQTRVRDALGVSVFLLICLGWPGARAGEIVDGTVRAQVLKSPDGPVSHIETEYNDIFISKERNLLTMSFQRYRGRYTESVSDLVDPADLPVPYTRVMTVGLAYPAKVERLLTIGLGGGSVPAYLAHYLSDLGIDNVELDPGVIAAAKKYFGLKETERVRYIESDGRVFLNRTHQAYDAIMVDAFRGGYVPFHLLTSEFYSLVKGHLTSNGVVLFNVHTGTKLYASTVKTLRASFPWVDLYRTGEGNIIAVAGASARPGNVDLMQRATALQKSYQFQYSLIRMLNDLVPDPDVSMAVLLTDDFAPVNLYDAIQEHNKKQW